jgi:WD40 repeat protein
MSRSVRSFLMALGPALACCATLFAEPLASPNKSATGITKPNRADLFGDPLPAGATVRLGTTRFRHESRVECAAFSPDGAILASSTGGRHIYLWNAATGEQIGHF